jgi:serine phosphatase RsbU (regulator of sigma subunit)
MLDFVLDSLKPRLDALANAWILAGATAYGIWEGGRPLAQWSAKPREPHGSGVPLVAPIFTNDLASLELRVVGADGADAQDRLNGEATLIAALIQLEEELEDVATRLIETQDRLLALYDLTHAARNQLSTLDTLDSLAKEASRLLRSYSAFAILAAPDATPIVAQQPLSCLSIEQVLRLFYQIQADQQEVQTTIELDSIGEALLPTRSNLFLMPIRVHSQVMAALGLLNQANVPFTSPEMKLARAIAEQGGVQLENALLLQETLAQARIQTEMELAQRVQLRLLPQRQPQVPGLEFAARSRPAFQVGGDFYDFMSGAERPFTFAVGDVSGKGMGAALVMSMMHTAVRGMGSRVPQPTPASTMAHVNEHLYDDLTEVGAFATMFVGQYGAGACRLNFANAGHSPVIYCPAGEPARLLEADGTAIGVLPISLCEDQSLSLRPDDLLIVATDGFSEAQNSAGEMFGYERMLRLSEALASLSAPDILGALFAAVEDFSVGHPQDDDQTALVLKGVPA